jgi:SAM-dependent methyltransferase
MDLSQFSAIEEYRQRALMGDIRAMAARDFNPAETDLAAEFILDLVKPVAGLLVDIGCGDGTLIEKASRRAPALRCVGTAATAEEAAKLNAVRGAFGKFQQATAQRTGLPDRSADYVVSNSCLHMAPPLDASLHEIGRIAKQGAPVFVGDMPFVLEPWLKNRPSVARIVASNLKHHGPSAAAGVLWYLARAAFAGEWTARARKPHLWIEPDEFVKAAAAQGLSLVAQFTPRLLNRGEVVASKTRFSYLLVRK